MAFQPGGTGVFGNFNFDGNGIEDWPRIPREEQRNSALPDIRNHYNDSRTGSAASGAEQSNIVFTPVASASTSMARPGMSDTFTLAQRGAGFRVMMMHSTISKDHTAGGQARDADLLASLGARTRNRVTDASNYPRHETGRRGTGTLETNSRDLKTSGFVSSGDSDYNSDDSMPPIEDSDEETPWEEYADHGNMDQQRRRPDPELLAMKHQLQKYKDERRNNSLRAGEERNDDWDLGIQEINRDGRIPPFPQWVQGAARAQLRTPAGEPSIKTDFSRMHSGTTTRTSGIRDLSGSGSRESLTTMQPDYGRDRPQILAAPLPEKYPKRSERRRRNSYDAYLEDIHDLPHQQSSNVKVYYVEKDDAPRVIERYPDDPYFSGGGGFPKVKVAQQYRPDQVYTAKRYTEDDVRYSEAPHTLTTREDFKFSNPEDIFAEFFRSGSQSNDLKPADEFDSIFDAATPGVEPRLRTNGRGSRLNKPYA